MKNQTTFPKFLPAVVVLLMVFLSACQANQAAAAENTVDLLWEADTQTPIFYHGRALSVKDSLVKLTAVANLFHPQTGAPLPREKLDYQWEKDGKAVRSVSGVGKNTISFYAGPGKNNFLRVTVTDPGTGRDDQSVATATTKIDVTAPKIVWYEKTPAGKINYRRALGDQLSLARGEFDLWAEAYYFPAKSQAGGQLTWSWFYNNQAVSSNPDQPNLMKLIVPSAPLIEQKNIINLIVAEQENRATQAEKNLEIIYGN